MHPGTPCSSLSGTTSHDPALDLCGLTTAAVKLKIQPKSHFELRRTPLQLLELLVCVNRRCVFCHTAWARFPGASRDVNDLVSTPFVRNTALAGVVELDVDRLYVTA